MPRFLSRRLMNGRQCGFVPDIERKHVQAVYSRIAHGFSNTRYKQWPRVAAFLAEQAALGQVLGVDVGCGNGKNMTHAGLCIVGVDLCTELLDAAQATHNHSGLVVRGTMVSLPLRSTAFDFGMCIAALHHLSTHTRRLAALCEISRVLRPGGRVLLYVWASENGSSDAVQGGRRRMVSVVMPCENSVSDMICKPESSVVYTRDIPTEKSTGTFEAAVDVLVPFKCDDDARYYHLFAAGELENLVRKCIPHIFVENSGWDSDNWWLVARRL